MLRSTLLVAAAALLSGGSPAQAQSPPGLPSDEWFVPKTGIIDTDAQIDAANIRANDFRSTPIGKQQNWNLDLGYFPQDFSEEPDLRDRVEERDQSFTGLRLSVPLSGNR